MPYIKLDNRLAYDTMLDGLINKLRGRQTVWLEMAVRYIPCAVLVDREPYLPVPDTVCGIVTDLVRRMKNNEAVKGDVNYVLTRLVLETLRPDTGWGYHSLSEAVALLREQADWVNTHYPITQQKDKVSTRDAVSVLRDVADEICRRLLGPYEDTAILKNGDMQCFQETYAHMPPVARARQVMQALRGEVIDAEFQPVDAEFPPVTEALTDEQYDIVEKEKNN